MTKNTHPSGLGTLYTLLYLSDLKNEMQYDSKRFTKDKKTISFFNVSTLTPFLKPFSKIKHARLVNFRATMNILEPSTELTQNLQFQNLWRDVNQGVVKNSKLLSLYQITLNSQTTSAGKIQSEQRDLAIMLVEGQFTTKQLKNQTERKFFNEREIQFVVRQLDFQSNTDTSVEDLSRIIGLLREQSAVVRPYRG